MIKKLNDTTWKQEIKADLRDELSCIIGDDKQLDFKPQMKIERWSNEVNMSIRFINDEKNQIIRTEDGKIKWIGDKVEAHWYNISNIDHLESVSEFEVILKEKPISNELKFSIEMKGLEFSKQEELSDNEVKKIAGLKKITLLEAKRLCRPENVVNSYVAYYKNCPINFKNGKLYRNRKAFHIYRVKATDANGVSVWGDQNIDISKKLYTIVFPQQFLDEALYPVVIDPTFGYATAGASLDICQNNVVLILKQSSPSNISGLPVTDISIYGGDSGGTTCKAKWGIFTDVSNRPLVTNGGGSEQTLNTTIGWKKMTLGTSPSLSNNTTYCFGIATNATGSNYLSIAYDSISASSFYFDSFDYSTFGALGASLISYPNHYFSIYATYTVFSPFPSFYQE
jgi:hypothetical protein